MDEELRKSANDYKVVQGGELWAKEIQEIKTAANDPRKRKRSRVKVQNNWTTGKFTRACKGVRTQPNVFGLEVWRKNVFSYNVKRLIYDLFPLKPVYACVCSSWKLCVRDIFNYFLKLCNIEVKSWYSTTLGLERFRIIERPIRSFVWTLLYIEIVFNVGIVISYETIITVPSTFGKG